MTFTLICHIYNEAFLLPFFVRHHLPLVDHAVIIDYASTDDSVAIVRRLAPSWEVRPSRNRFFRCTDVDREVMDVEREFDGWKIALNVTEFLFHPDIKAWLADKEAMAYALPSVVMCDVPEGREAEINPLLPLWQQRHHGYWDDPKATPGAGRSLRYLHRARDGRYTVGRHQSGVPSTFVPDLFLQWWGWSPMRYVQERKLQIKTRIPTDDRMLGHGIQHQIDAAGMEALYQGLWGRAVDLRGDERYSARLAEMEAVYAVRSHPASHSPLPSLEGTRGARTS